ncbi:transporter [Rhizobium sp. DKSPLA3]|uniref:Transporter n=1 Tax=Rhizobium quercicola TaxID=2901226 RepID=A0A9X1T2H6_9HYPH|nr:transporter [Rhizobium quercicola]MCD7111567.1 transporter [Rhizobium quercicola]
MMGGNYSPALWLGLTGTPLMIAMGQVLFKLSSRTTGEFGLGGIVALLLNPLMIAALAVYGIGTLVWIFVLKSVPLTIAYSFMALTFCFVPLLASVFLGETLTLRTAIGAALLIGGMIVINS